VATAARRVVATGAGLARLAATLRLSGRGLGVAGVAAVPPAAMLRLLPEPWARHPVPHRAATPRWSPTLNAYLLYDRPVLAEETAAGWVASLEGAVRSGWEAAELAAADIRGDRATA
jgi:hypothetical protein